MTSLATGFALAVQPVSAAKPKSGSDVPPRLDTLEVMRPRFVLFLLIPVLLAGQSIADLQKTFEKKVTEFTLPNGLHFIVIERHDAPVLMPTGGGKSLCFPVPAPVRPGVAPRFGQSPHLCDNAAGHRPGDRPGAPG